MIDCHFHIWDIKKSYYRWLTPDLTKLYHTFSIEDYKNTTKPFGIKSAIVIQAADDTNETLHLLKVAQNNKIIKGVIGWIDFESDTVIENLRALVKHKQFKGVRPMLQDIEDVNWINNPQFEKIFKELEKNNLIFEALIKQNHLKNIIDIAKKYPDLKIIINHGAKPIIDGDLKDKKFIEWQTLIKEISSYKNVTCKLSGLVTECINKHSKKEIIPYLQTIIKYFTSTRVIWGSDWPVVKLKCTYEEWVDLSRDLLSNLEKKEQQNIFVNSAKSIYNIQS